MNNLDPKNLHKDINGFISEIKTIFPDLRITSGYRSGARTKKGLPSRHSKGEAIDIEPRKEVYEFLYNTPKGLAMLQRYGLGILDETTNEALAKTGGTAPHYHIGKDSTLVNYLNNRISKLSQEDKSVFNKAVSENKKVEKITENDRSRIERLNFTDDGNTFLYNNPDRQYFSTPSASESSVEEESTDKDISELKQQTNERKFLEELSQVVASQQQEIESLKSQKQQEPYQQEQQSYIPQSENYMDIFNKVSEFIDNPIAQQGGILATKRDSLDLQKYSLKKNKEMLDRGFILKTEESGSYPNVHKLNSEKLEELKKRIEEKKVTQVINNEGKREPKPYNPNLYYRPISEHKYFNQETDIGVLDPNSSYLLFDRRVSPTEKKTWMNPNTGDGATTYGYNFGEKYNPKTTTVKKKPISTTKPTAQKLTSLDKAANYMQNGGNLIKRADGSYSKKGLWDNIRANKGSGKKPTKEMLEQEKKIKSKYQDGGKVTKDDNVDYNYVNYGTPEYEQAYNEGRFAFNSNQLDEVTVTPYDKQFPFYQKLKPSEQKYLRENLNSNDPITRQLKARAVDGRGFDADKAKDFTMGWLRDMPLASLQAPQSAMVEGIEALRGNEYNMLDAIDPGKQRVPSKAWNIENPYAAFATDMLVDPALVGTVGNLARKPIQKGLQRIPTSISPELRQGVKTQGFINKLNKESFNEILNAKVIPTFQKTLPNKVNLKETENVIKLMGGNKELAAIHIGKNSQNQAFPMMIHVDSKLWGNRTQDLLYDAAVKKSQREGYTGLTSGQHLLSPLKTAKAHERFNYIPEDYKGIGGVEVKTLTGHKNPNIEEEWFENYKNIPKNFEKTSLSEIGKYAAHNARDITLGTVSLGTSVATTDMFGINTFYPDYESKIIKWAREQNNKPLYQGQNNQEETPQFQQGGVIKDNNGYWNPDNWGKEVEISSPNITMKGVNEPLIGTADTGEQKLMFPNYDYHYEGAKKVKESPLTENEKLFLQAYLGKQGNMQQGGVKTPIYKDFSDFYERNKDLQHYNTDLKRNSNLFTKMLDDKVQFEYCEGEQCMSRANRVNDAFSQKYPYFEDTFSKTLPKIGVTYTKKGKPTEEEINKYPYFKGDEKVGSFDSWDAATQFELNAPDKVVFNTKGDYSKAISYNDIMKNYKDKINIGAYIGLGTHGDKDKTFANHTVRVVGYLEDGEPLVADNGTIRKLSEAMYLNGYKDEKGISHILNVNDKYNFNHFKSIEDSKKINKPSVRYLDNLDKLPIVKDGKVSYEKPSKEFKNFHNTLGTEKSYLTKSLGIKFEDYDRYSKIAITLAANETEYGNSLTYKLLDKFKESKGLTQLRLSNVKDLYKDTLSKYKEGSDEYNAVATILYLKELDKYKDDWHEKGTKNRERVYNLTKSDSFDKKLVRSLQGKEQTGFIEQFGLLDKNYYNDGQTKFKLPYRQVWQDDKSYTEEVNDYLKENKLNNKFSFKIEDGKQKIVKKTAGTTIPKTLEDIAFYAWQSPKNVVSGDAQGNSAYYKKNKELYNLLFNK